MGKAAEALERQQSEYDAIRRSVGSETLAVYICCIIFDLPFEHSVLPAFGDETPWESYVRSLKHKGLYKNKNTGNPRGFGDGETDFSKMFGEAVALDDILGIFDKERSSATDLERPAKSSQVQTWGIGNSEHPYTAEDYDRLDYFYSTLTSRLKRAGGVDAQQELVLRKVSELFLMDEQFRSVGNIADAQKAVKMALDLLSSEQLQKKDAKPIENVRIDSIIKALEDWGAVENGKILGFEDLQELLLKKLGRLGGKPAHNTYKECLDAADYELLFIRNCMAANEDLPILEELPDEMRFSDEVANEFSQGPTEKDLEVYEFCEIVPTRPGTNPEG